MRSPYEKIDILGIGVFGRVWKVNHIGSGKFYALKQATKVNNWPVLFNEMEILKIVGEHENIVRYIDSFLSETVEENYVVTEFCDKGSLEDYIVSIIKEVVAYIESTDKP